MLPELLILLALLVANGIFSMTELAVVSAKKSRLQRLADDGDHKAVRALKLTANITRFLSTIQLGITAISIFSGLYSGETLVTRFQLWLGQFPLIAAYASIVAKLVVVGSITFLTIVIGELIPKRLAMLNPEGIARWVAGFMLLLAKICNPIVYVLSITTDFILKSIGLSSIKTTQISDQEIFDLMLEGRSAGVFDEVEQDMIEGVLSLDTLSVEEIMTPRPKIIFLNIEESAEHHWHKIVVSGHSTFPVYDGNRDNIVGIVSVKSLYANTAAGAPARLNDLMIKPLIVPETQNVRKLLNQLREHRFHIALVADEFGNITGLVTMNDVSQAVLGDIPSRDERLKPAALQRDDGTWLIDGLIDLETVQSLLPNLNLPEDALREYQTLAGFVFGQLSRVPSEGECFNWHQWRFEILDMDRHRVDKLLLTYIGDDEVSSV